MKIFLICFRAYIKLPGFSNKKSNTIKCHEIVILTNNPLLVQLSSNSQWFLDATFKIAPKDFSQVLNIIVYNPRLRLYIPTCFILMSNKTESSYTMALECLKQIALSLKLSLSPTPVMSDFELALRNGIKNSFPNAQISGCYFHYTKCLWNKISKLGLRTKELKEKSNVL